MSKLATLLHAIELSRRLKVSMLETDRLIDVDIKNEKYMTPLFYPEQEEGAAVTVNSVHPGIVATHIADRHPWMQMGTPF